MKLILKWMPEGYFLFLSIWLIIDSYVNWEKTFYPAIILLLILIFQSYKSSRVTGLILSWILGLISVYLIFALLSDLAKVPIFTLSSLQFLLIGGLIITCNIRMSLLMFKKYNKGNKVMGQVN